jgi:hypothetical protein
LRGALHSRSGKLGKKGRKESIFDGFRGVETGGSLFRASWRGFGAGWGILRSVRRLGKGKEERRVCHEANQRFAHERKSFDARLTPFNCLALAGYYFLF